MTLLGAESGSYLVGTDSSSGIGSLTVGPTRFSATANWAASGWRYYTESNPFNVVL